MQEQKIHKRSPSSGKYIFAFIGLLCLLALTVFLSYLKRGFAAAVIVALGIATLQSFLAGGIFMHLIKERPVIFWLLALAFILFISILILPYAGLVNDVRTNVPVPF